MTRNKRAAAQAAIDTAWQMLVMFAVVAAAGLVPPEAMASDKIGTTLCRGVSLVTGNVGKALATLALIVIGMGALLGKVSWGMAIIVGVGIALIFGADTVMKVISGQTDVCKTA